MKIDFSTERLPESNSEFEQEVIIFTQEWLSDSKTVEVQTSGSTGIPKIFKIEKDRMRQSAKMTCDILDLHEGDSALLCLPIEYISGKMMIVRAIERKLVLMVVNPSTKPLEDLNQKIDFCAMSPLQVENSLDKIHFIKNLIIGGAAVSESLKTKIHNTLRANTSHDPNIFETYGMSETLSHIALKRIYPIAEDYFTTLDNVEISLDDKGCLQINAPKLNPEVLKTNDLVDIKNRNQFRFKGRVDNVINSGGLKIYPEELEKLAKQNISNEVVFAGVDDDLLGQKLVLIVEGKDSKNIREQLLQVSYPSKNHQPKEIHFIPDFPRIPNGKVNRKELLNLL